MQMAAAAVLGLVGVAWLALVCNECFVDPSYISWMTRKGPFWTRNRTVGQVQLVWSIQPNELHLFISRHEI